MEAKVNDKTVRVTWIDVAKGIGIILVMYTHIEGPHKRLFHMFVVQLFFVLSGFVFNPQKVKKNCLRLIKQSLLFCSLATIIYSTYSNFSITYLISFLGGGAASRFVFDPAKAYWFISCLICTEILMSLICKLFIDRKLMYYVMIFVTALSGFMLSKYNHYSIPWNMDIAIICMPFFLCGFLFFEEVSSFVSSRAAKIQVLKGVLLCVCVLTLMVGYKKLRLVNLFRNDYAGNPLLMYACSFAGVIAVIIIGELIARNRFFARLFSKIGRNTIPILLLHQSIFVGIDHYNGKKWMKVVSTFILTLVVLLKDVILDRINNTNKEV